MPGLEVRRGVSVTRLETRRIDRRLHVTGVRDEDGGRLAADLVVDAMGRRALLRAVVREHGDHPAELASAWDEATERELTPWYRATVAVDRARLAEIDAIRTGARPQGALRADPAARMRAALPRAMGRDPEAFRAALEISSCLALPEEVFARPGLAQLVLEAAGDDVEAPPTGPTREQVLQLVR